MTGLCTSALRAACVAAAAFMVCGGPASGQKPGGSITVGLELDIPGLDPLKVGVYDTAAEMAAALIFDTLTSLDDKGVAVPKLALSWTHSDDFKTWTFKLRSGVKFHDGTPFNAQAVAWNIARQKDPNNHCRCAFYIQNIEKVEAVDDLTVVYHLRDPAAALEVRFFDRFFDITDAKDWNCLRSCDRLFQRTSTAHGTVQLWSCLCPHIGSLKST